MAWTFLSVTQSLFVREQASIHQIEEEIHACHMSPKTQKLIKKPAFPGLIPSHSCSCLVYKKSTVPPFRVSPREWLQGKEQCRLVYTKWYWCAQRLAEPLPASNNRLHNFALRFDRHEACRKRGSTQSMNYKNMFSSYWNALDILRSSYFRKFHIL